MISLPYGLSIDLSSLLAGITLTAIAGWLASFLALRKDERAVQLDQITRERTKWRNSIRKATEDIAQAYHDNKSRPIPARIAVLRAKLVTSINPKDDKDDDLILSHFDELFADSRCDIDLFTKRIGLLLKHDWERVKWECTPIYIKVFTRYSAKQRKWRKLTYREI